MIKIEILKKKQEVSKIKIYGHADYDDYGRDIVCAAVSSIVTTTVNGILSIKDTIEVTDNGKLLEITVKMHDEVTDKLLENMIQLFKGIETQYKKNVKVIQKGE